MNSRTTWIGCASCNQKTSHLILFEVDDGGASDDGMWDIDAENRYSVVQCEGCKTYSFLHKHFYVGSEDGREAIDVTDTVQYPRRIDGRQPIPHRGFLPIQLQRIYIETRNALCNDMNVLAGIGIRALVEVVCKERDAPGRNLQKKIDGLVQVEDLTPAGATILHNLRTMGNSAAHEVKAHTSKDLATAFEVVEHLLTGIYILPAKASNLPK
ncbi:MAG: DUF4145 domain-containing protein [Flavobacteriales bacterium]